MTSPISGSYSKGIFGGFDEDERLLLGLMQRGIPVVDADENRKELQRYTWIRRAIETVIGNASPNFGFKIVGDGATNDVQVSGGDGTLNGAGRIWVAGIHCFLKSNIRFVNTGATSDQAIIHPKVSFVSGLGNITLEDSSANYVVNSLTGRTITVNIATAATATVVSNTARTITTNADLTAAGVVSGTQYRVEMSTPSGAGRNDGVYLNVSIEEVNGTEVPGIQHNLGTLLTAQLFARVRSRVEVHQGDTSGLPGDLSTSYIDADGFEHFRIKIADITRFDGVGAIAAPDVTDRRFTSVNFTNFLNKNGDTMVGDLDMSGADIIMDALRLVDGRDVSEDGAKLDTITFTGPGVAALLPKISWPVQGTDQTNVTTSTVSVGGDFLARTPGGTESVKGVFTTPPNNRVILLSSADQDDIIDDTGDKVFGRLTESHPSSNLTGTWQFTNASTTITEILAAGAALTELAINDVLIAPTGVFHRVASVTDNNTVEIDPAFDQAGGAAVQTIPTPALRRWILSLVKNDEGSETTVTPGAGGVASPLSLSYFFQEVFDASDRPVINPVFAIPSDQVAAEMPPASVSVAGKVALTKAGATVGVIAEVDDGGGLVGSGNFRKLIFPAGGVVESAPGELTINSTGATGGTGPSGGTGPTGPPGPTGPAGPGFTSVGPHQEDGGLAASPSRSSSSSFNFGFDPKFYMVSAELDNAAGALDPGWVTNVVIAGQNVNVSWTTDDGGSVDAAATFQISCSAAG